MSENRPLQQPAQTDWQAANSATPDTDKLPQWDDSGWDAYLYAVDLNYRVDWDIAHGAEREAVRAMIDDWEESHENDDEDDEDAF